LKNGKTIMDKRIEKALNIIEQLSEDGKINSSEYKDMLDALMQSFKPEGPEDLGWTDPLLAPFVEVEAAPPSRSTYMPVLNVSAQATSTYVDLGWTDPLLAPFVEVEAAPPSRSTYMPVLNVSAQATSTYVDSPIRISESLLYKHYNYIEFMPKFNFQLLQDIQASLGIPDLEETPNEN
jgi:hypothetical protein